MIEKATHVTIFWNLAQNPEKNSSKLNVEMAQMAEIFEKYVFQIFSFFRRDALKEQFGKEPSTVRCLAVKSALLGTRHPRKEKEAALQNVTGEPACLCSEFLVCHSIGDRTKFCA